MTTNATYHAQAVARPFGRTETAIVLAAGAPPPGLAAIFGRTSSAMVPLNGRPTIHWLLHYLYEQGIRRVVLGLRHTETRVPRFVQQAFGNIHSVTCVPIEQDLGPGFTLLQCLNHLRADESCLIVLGDTLFEFPTGVSSQSRESFVLTAPVQDATRWCLAQVSDTQEVRALLDKPTANPDRWPALVGVYHLLDCAPACSALQSRVDAGDRSLQLHHALQPYIDRGQLKAYPAGQWFDCGNLDLLTSSRRRLLQARSFNTIRIDELHGTLTKRSQHGAKFINEINYYRLLPRDLATFFPRIVDFSLAPNDVFLTLEYYGYPTLSEVWVFEEFESRYWESVFETLQRILACFGQYTTEFSAATTFDFYWRKTLERIELFANQDREFARLTEATEIDLNGQHLAGWPRIRHAIEASVRQLSVSPRGQIIHGDLCFTNLLYDPVSRLFKLIDPRGSFGDSGLYGDGRYDLAKLLHSLDGGYDFLIHDMFKLDAQGNRIHLQQFFPATRSAILQAFSRVFFQDNDRDDIRLIEGLLFLSMCPLHRDFRNRQIAMFATSLRILNGLLNHEDMY